MMVKALRGEAQGGESLIIAEIHFSLSLKMSLFFLLCRPQDHSSAQRHKHKAWLCLPVETHRFSDASCKWVGEWGKEPLHFTGQTSPALAASAAPSLQSTNPSITKAQMCSIWAPEPWEHLWAVVLMKILTLKFFFAPVGSSGVKGGEVPQHENKHC